MALKVAGPAALLMLKVYKKGERLEDSGHRQRQLSKDAFNIYRLLRAIDTPELAEESGLLRSREISGDVASKALLIFQSLFGSRSDRGPEDDPAFIIESSVALSQDLLQAITQ